MDVSLSGWALVAAAVFWAILVAFLCVVLLSLFRVLTSTRDLLEDLRRQVVPMLSDVNETVDGVNRELVQVEGILESVKGTVTAVEKVTTTLATAIANPAVRGVALAAGAARAWQKMRER